MPEPSSFEQDVLAANGISPEVLSNGEIKIKLKKHIRAAKTANMMGAGTSIATISDFGVQRHLENIEILIEQIKI